MMTFPVMKVAAEVQEGRVEKRLHLEEVPAAAAAAA
jgi:hypothetical protein